MTSGAESAKRKRILLCIGTRPEAIKLGPVYLALQAHAQVELSLCVTGQHREMLDPMLQLFGMQVQYDLNLMRVGQRLNALSSQLLAGLDQVMDHCQPDWVVVQGDTTTAAMAAWAAFHRRIPIAHVEAGLRTYQTDNPYPEEVNRRSISLMAQLHFAPTVTAQQQLLAEGIAPERVIVTGNTVIDAAQWVLSQLEQGYTTTTLTQIQHLAQTPYYLITAHRRELWGKGLENLCRAIRAWALRCNRTLVFPVHLNPDIQKVVQQHLSDLPQVVLLPPLGYPEFIYALQHCQGVLTDSGGLQEEAAWLGKSVLVARAYTERSEGIQAGIAALVAQDQALLLEKAAEMDRWSHTDQTRNLYGDGRAAQRIVQHLTA